MTPRGTDWTLALLVAALAVSGLGTWFAGTPSAAWVVVAHDVIGLALAAVVVLKLRRVAPRLARSRWDGRTVAGAAAVTLVVLALASGVAWSSGADVSALGYGGLAWHVALGGVLAAAVLAHAVLRAKRPRRRDLAGRRQMLVVGAGAVAAWALQRPLADLLGWRGADRRYTGSYERGSFSGNGYPSTSWVADDPRPLPSDHRVVVEGLVGTPLALVRDDLDAGHAATCLLDCTGGWYTRQRWRGTRLLDVVARADPRPEASHVRVVSTTGYRWSFALEDAGNLLLATHVAGVPIDHDHGAPVRLVAPGRRGFQWVKWVDRVELHSGPDAGAPASTVLSSL